VRTRSAVLGAAALMAVTGCNTSGDGGGDGSSDGDLTVLAAASLTEPFGELAERFEAEHPGVEVSTSFDSSATIAAQVDAGAPADVVATADPRTMRIMADAVEDPVTFAHNELVLAVPSGNPAGITELADLARADYVVCAPSAPCGALAVDLLDRAGVTRAPRSREVDVKAVLTKVQLDEADAGLVYASDVEAAGDRVEQVPLPAGSEAATSYPVAVVSGTDQAGLAQEWVDLVLSAEGQQVLTAAGFAPVAEAEATR
jgi:molybdate transport system substrate-binding protein